MGKLTIQEVARVLAERNKLKVRECDVFAKTMFAVIQDGLERDGQVKVRGLGTFKIINVEARESVDVSTGERVVIAARSKLTFTPDATMKELINKPFSQFETVVLNDGVEFEDLEPEDEVEPDTPDEPSEPEVPVALYHPASQPEDNPDEEVPEEENPEETEDTVVDEQSDEPQPVIPDDPVEVGENSSWKWWLFGLLTLLLMAASAYGGYLYGRHTAQEAPQSLNTEKETVQPVEAPVDTVTTVEEDTLSVQPTEEATPPAVSEPEKNTFDSDKYDQADARVRLGAYRIIGVAKEVTVHDGETLYRISRRELGDDMECYVQALNEMGESTVVKTGQKLKIPKLEWRKKRR